MSTLLANEIRKLDPPLDQFSPNPTYAPSSLPQEKADSPQALFGNASIANAQISPGPSSLEPNIGQLQSAYGNAALTSAAFGDQFETQAVPLLEPSAVSETELAAPVPVVSTEETNNEYATAKDEIEDDERLGLAETATLSNLSQTIAPLSSGPRALNDVIPEAGQPMPAVETIASVSSVPLAAGSAYTSNASSSVTSEISLANESATAAPFGVEEEPVPEMSAPTATAAAGSGGGSESSGGASSEAGPGGAGPPASGAPASEGGTAGGTAEGGPAPTLDTTSGAGLLESMTAVPASSFVDMLGQAKTAAPVIQQREREQVEEDFPIIEQPTGLPVRSAPPQPTGLPGPAGSVPEMPSAEGSETSLPDVAHDVASGPLPGSAAMVSSEPVVAEAEEESWWDWLFGAIRNFISQLPTLDPGLSTSAGERPPVELSGDSDPALMMRHEETSNTEVQKGRAQADDASYADFGENDIYPTIPTEMMCPSTTIGTPLTGGKGGGLMAPDLSAESRTALDQAGALLVREQVTAQTEVYRQQEATYEEQSAAIRAEGQQRLDDETERTRSDQGGMQEQARLEVDTERRLWREQNRRMEEEFASKSATQREQTEQQIQTHVQATDRQVDDTLSNAERDAETERLNTEARAAEMKRDAEQKPRGFWDSIRGAVSDFFAGLRAVINGLFNLLRKAVEVIISAAKAIVRGLIEAARIFVVGLIQGFGLLLKGLVTITLMAFPEQAAAAREFIDGKVNGAVATVNETAETLKRVADTILTWIGESLIFVLDVVQAALLFALDVLEFIAGALVTLMQLLYDFQSYWERVRPMIESIMALINDPTPAIEAIKEYFGGKIAQVPEMARSITRKAITFSPPPPDHWAGILRHLEPKLTYLANNWWQVIKDTAWFMIWPFDDKSPLWKDAEELWTAVSNFFSAIWDLDGNKAIDSYLKAQQLVVSIVNLFYGWVFIGLVVGFAIAGGIAGVEVGVVPGIIAGAGVGLAYAETVGLALVAATAGAEGAVLAKAGIDLVMGDQTPAENEEDYEAIAGSGLTLVLILALVAIGAVAARIGKALIKGASRAAGAIARAVLGPRATQALEAALARLRLKVRLITEELRNTGGLKFKSGGVTRASYEGPARKLHPERFDEIITDLERNGVDINVRDGGDPWTGAYTPAEGKPGGMNVHRDVDLRTLEHEYRHFLDDKANGYPGLRHYLENPQKMWQMEEVAYDTEIDMVRSDKTLTPQEQEVIIQELEAAKALERERLLGSGGEGNE